MYKFKCIIDQIYIFLSFHIYILTIYLLPKKIKNLYEWIGNTVAPEVVAFFSHVFHGYIGSNNATYPWRIGNLRFSIISYFPCLYVWMNVNIGSHCSCSQYPSVSDACGSSPVRPYLPVMEETGFDGVTPFRFVPRFIMCAVSGALTGFVAVGSFLWILLFRIVGFPWNS